MVVTVTAYLKHQDNEHVWASGTQIYPVNEIPSVTLIMQKMLNVLSGDTVLYLLKLLWIKKRYMSSVVTLSADVGWLRRGKNHFHTSALHPYQIENGALLGYYASSSGNFLPILAV